VNDEHVKTRATEMPTVYVVDDDDDVRESLEQLLKSAGMKTIVFPRGEALIDAFESGSIRGPACIVLDVRLRGLSGLMVQKELSQRGVAHPVIFITGHGDIVMTVKAMKAGAVNFLTKPIRDQDLFEAIAEAIELDRTRIAEATATENLKDRWLELTPRQRQVMHFVASGMPNRTIAEELGIAEITVKIYRGEGMRRLGTKTLSEFLEKAKMLGIVTEPPRYPMNVS
jgi:FixJ family two-component response regulator